MASSRITPERNDLMGHNHLGNRITELEHRILREEDQKKRAKLEEKKKECERILGELTAPIGQVDDRKLKEALHDLTSLNEAIKTFNEDGGLSYAELAQFSPYSPFFDEDIISKINHALEPGEHDVTRSVRRNTDAIFSVDRVTEDELEADWQSEVRRRKMEQLRTDGFSEHRGQIEWEIEALRSEAQEIKESNDIDPQEKTIALNDIDERMARATGELNDLIQKFNREEILNDNDLAPALGRADEPSPEEKDIWIDEERIKRRFLLKRKNTITDLRERVPESEMSNIQSVLEEVRAYRSEALKEHIRGKLDEAKKAYKATGASMKAISQLDDFERGLTSEFLSNPQNAAQALKAMEDLEHTKITLQNRVNRLNDPEKVKEARKKLALIKTTLTPLAGHAKELGEMTKNVGSPALQKRLSDPTGIAALSNPQLILDLESDLDSSSAQDKENALRTIEDLHRNIRSQEARKAQEIIARLPAQNSIADAISLVKQVAGEEHLEYVDNRTFEREYRKYTSKGDMVFYKRGDDWKIIVDKEAIEKGDPAETHHNFNKQIIHELRHLAFEFDDLKKRDVVQRYTSHAGWANIKTLFVEKANPKAPPRWEGAAKETYSPDDWPDEAVISEIMAMRGDFERRSATGGGVAASDLFGKLNAALVAANLLPQDLDDKQPKAEIFGREGDDDEGGGEVQGGGGTKADSAERGNFKTDTLKNRIQAAMESPHIGQLKDGKQALDDMMSALNSYPDDESVSKAVDDHLGVIENEIRSQSSAAGNTDISPMRSWWERTKFVSIYDVVAMANSTWEFYKRRHQRREQDHAARMGQALFSKIPFMQEVALHASAEQEKAEAEYVNEWKSRLENKDSWALLSMVDDMNKDVHPNKDQLKAILRILSEKGRIDWNQPSLWSLLNKLQDIEYFSPNDPFLLKNPAALNQKMQNAMGTMWDYEEFMSLQNKNESSYNSRKKEFMTTYDKMAGQLNVRLNEMLKAKKNNKEADPMEYEAILEYAIKNGKSSQETITFYLIAGMADGLLAPDRGIRLNAEYLNSFPPIDFFTSFRPPLTQDDFKRMCEGNFRKEFEKGKSGSAFQRFYWTEILNNNDVIERIKKQAGPDVWDHDWTRGYGAIGGADTAQRLLSGKSGTKATRPTAAQNAYCGSLQWLEENAKRVRLEGDDRKWKKHIADQLGWAVMADGIMSGVAYSSDKTYTRDDSIIGSKPRERGAGYHPDGYTIQFQARIQEVLDTLDPTIFQLMRIKGMDETRRLAAIKTHLTTNYSDNPELMADVEGMISMDKVFGSTQLIVNAVVAKRMNKEMQDTLIDVLVDKKGNALGFKGV